MLQSPGFDEQFLREPSQIISFLQIEDSGSDKCLVIQLVREVTNCDDFTTMEKSCSHCLEGREWVRDLQEEFHQLPEKR